MNGITWAAIYQFVDRRRLYERHPVCSKHGNFSSKQPRGSVIAERPALRAEYCIVDIPHKTAVYQLTTVADVRKFSAVRRLSRRLIDWSKNAILPTPRAFGAPVGVISIRISF